MAGTNVTYNGVTLKNVLTRSWDMEAVYEQDDTLSYYKLRMTFETIFLPYSTNDHMGITDGAHTTAPGTWNLNKRKLMTPRKPLLITMNGATVLDITPVQSGGAQNGKQGSEIEIHNGPKPTSLDFDSVFGSSSIKATWTVEACIGPCDTKLPPVLASRWSVTETMDEDFFITRVFSGYVKKRNSKHSSSSYRWWMYPPLEPGFKRTNVTFDEHPDHLGIDWQVTDRQVHTAPPWPCTKLEGSQTETTGNGIVWHSEVRVRASGSPEASKRDMFAQCARIIEMRIGYRPEDAVGAKDGGKFLVKGCTMVDHFGSKNQVEMVMRIMHNWGANEAKKDKFKTFLTNLRGRIADPAYYDLAKKAPGNPANEPAPYDKLKSRLPWAWGYTPHGAKRTAELSARWEHYLTNLCQAVDRPNKYGVGDAKTYEKETEKATDRPTTVDYDQSLPKDSNMYDPKEQESLYTLARVEDEYSYDARKIVLPVMYQDDYSDKTASVTGSNSYAACLGEGVVYRVITVEYERIGDWPSIPDLATKYSDDNNNHFMELLSHRVVAKPPSPGQDGKQILYAVWAQYVYVSLNRMGTKTIADWDWNLVSLPMTTVTHHIDHKKLWRDVNGASVQSGKGNMSSGR